MAAGRGKALALLGLGLGAWLLRPKGSTVTDIRLSPHFRLSEFLRSGSFPELAGYVPTPAELANLRALTGNVLEPLRVAMGSPVVVTGGGRPLTIRNARGQTIDDALRARGYNPDPDSDHHHFGAADIGLPGRTLADYVSAYVLLRRDPDVRQVVLELESDPKTGRVVPDHIHVAVVLPGFPRIAGDRFAFAMLDGKRTDSSLYA